MLILHVIPGDLWAGAESQVFYTIRELKRQSAHEVVAILFSKKELYKKLVNEKVTTHVIDEEFNNGFVIISGIKNIILKMNPDIIHVHDYKGHTLTYLAKYLSGIQCRILRTIHGHAALPANIKYIQYLKGSIILQLEDKILLRYLTDCIIAVSKDINGVLNNKYKKNQICQINNAVQLRPDEQDTEHAHDAREQFHVDDNTYWIGTAARLVDVKNIRMLIDAAKIIKKKNICNYKVSIFGEGPLRRKLQQQIEQHDLIGQVFLEGHHNNFSSIVGSLDTFVLTSLNEGLPMSLLEAMSMGTVPVCTKVGGMQEVIENEESGYLVESGSSVDLAEVLALLCENAELRDSVGRKARRRVQSHYSIESSVEKLLRLYESFR